MILTGPPGTAKTTLAELVARRPQTPDAARLHADDGDRGLDDLRDDRRPQARPEAATAFQEGHFLEAIRRQPVAGDR